MSKSGASWAFTYDADGLRTEKTDGDLTYRYIYSGSQLRYLEIERNEVIEHRFIFRYGADGMPYSVRFDGDEYFYVLNLQGDVIGIRNKSGAMVATYTYDAWGKVLTATNSDLANYNPLRYRSYVYDQETELYYLQSRYYNPAWGRFISADGLVSAGQGLSGNNMFAYCGNNPVMGYDPLGSFDIGGFFGGVAILAVGVVAVVATVATAGTASPLAAAAIMAVGTAVSVATIETGAAITAAAATDSAAVLDFSCIDGMSSQTYGCSFVIDFGNDTAEAYSHYGMTSSSSYGASYGAGVVFNYNKLGDYGGDFVDVSGSIKHKGFDYGLDVCWDPTLKGTAAISGTVGLSLPPIRSGHGVDVGYDYYVPIGSVRW